jgi:hypothetical protein
MNKTLSAAVGIAVCAIALTISSPSMAQEPADGGPTIDEIDMTGFENLETYLNAVAAPPDDAPAPLPPAAPVEPAADVVEAPPSVEAPRSLVTLPRAGGFASTREVTGVGFLALLALALLFGGSAAIAAGATRGRVQRAA